MIKKQTLIAPSLPHTQLDKNYVSCAYSMKILKFAHMMSKLGYKVITLGGEDVELAENNHTHVPIISKKEQEEFFGDPNSYKKTFYNISWNPSDKHWQVYNQRTIDFVRQYQSEHPDENLLLCLVAGVCQKQVADALPDVMSGEFFIGYTGVFSKYKVYESHAWQSFVHGRLDNDNGEFYETVIPNYYNPDEFPFSEKRGNYFLYIGRLIDRKGYRIAQEVCEKLGKKLILAGQIEGEFKGYGEYIGTVGVEERGKLMSEARAVFTPTTYWGPFEGTHAEAQLCGTPVITTPFGVYNDTIVDGFNGMRCYTFKDFVMAVLWAQNLIADHRIAIRENAQEKWGWDNVAKQYDKYFQRLDSLNRGGWYEL